MDDRSLSPISRRGVLGLAAGLAATRWTPVRAQALERVSVRLDWLPGADHSAMFLARERGYYEKAGLDVDILAGQGSLSTLQLVASGNHTIGLASLSGLTLAVAKDMPVVGIAGIMQRAPECVISLATTDIKKPSDLEGKTYGAVPGDQAQKLFDAFVQATKVDASKIKKVNVNYSASLTTLLNGNVDFIVAWASPDATKVAQVKPINPPMMFSDYGVNTLSTGIFVTRETAKAKADVLRRFLQATVQGAADVEKDPIAGVDAVHKANPETKVEVLKLEVEALPKFLHTDHSKGHGYGWVAQEDLEQTIAIQEKYYDMKPGLTPKDIYTGEFLPVEG